MKRHELLKRVRVFGGASVRHGAKHDPAPRHHEIKDQLAQAHPQTAEQSPGLNPQRATNLGDWCMQLRSGEWSARGDDGAEVVLSFTPVAGRIGQTSGLTAPFTPLNPPSSASTAPVMNPDVSEHR